MRHACPKIYLKLAVGTNDSYLIVYFESAHRLKKQESNGLGPMMMMMKDDSAALSPQDGSIVPTLDIRFFNALFLRSSINRTCLGKILNSLGKCTEKV